MDFDDDLQPKEEARPRKPRSFLLLLILIFIAIMMVVWTKSGFAPGSRIAEVSIEEYLKLKPALRNHSSFPVRRGSSPLVYDPHRTGRRVVIRDRYHPFSFLFLGDAQTGIRSPGRPGVAG